MNDVGSIFKNLSQKIIKHILCISTAFTLHTSIAHADAPQLLFYVSAKENLTADIAAGEAQPNFRDQIKRTQTGIPGPDGKPGWAIEWADDGVLSWNAPGNIYAQRGTLSFFWRSRYPVTQAPFVIFRVGYADHSSWDRSEEHTSELQSRENLVCRL